MAKYSVGDRVWHGSEYVLVNSVPKDPMIAPRVFVSNARGDFAEWVYPEDLHSMSLADRIRRIEAALGLTDPADGLI